MDVVQIVKDVGIVVSTVISVGAALSAITPTPKDDAFFKPLVKLVNVLGLNVRHAKNGGK